MGSTSPDLTQLDNPALKGPVYNADPLTRRKVSSLSPNTGALMGLRKTPQHRPRHRQRAPALTGTPQTKGAPSTSDQRAWPGMNPTKTYELSSGRSHRAPRAARLTRRFTSGR